MTVNFNTLNAKNTNFSIRTASMNDLSQIVNLENDMWPEDQRCSEENFVKRLNVFPDGFFLVINNDNVLVGYFFGIIKNFSLHTGGYSWDSSTDYGTGLSHDENGNTLFGVSITVHSDAPKGVLRAIIEGWREVGRAHGLKYIAGGSRIAGLIDFEGTPEEYLSNVINGSIFDPVLSKYIACGMKASILLPNYFDDPESKDFGVEVYNIIE